MATKIDPIKRPVLESDALNPDDPTEAHFHGDNYDNLSNKPDSKYSRPTCEAPIHREALKLLASGHKACEVAKKLKVSPRTVSNWMHTEWFVNRLAKLQGQAQKSILDEIKKHGSKAVRVLVEILDNPESTERGRITAAIEILDRILGKPTQHIESNTTIHSDDPVAEVARLERENDALRKQGYN